MKNILIKNNDKCKNTEIKLSEKEIICDDNSKYHVEIYSTQDIDYIKFFSQLIKYKIFS